MIDVDVVEFIESLDVIGGNLTLSESSALIDYVNRCITIVKNPVLNKFRLHDTEIVSKDRAMMKLKYQVSSMIAAMRTVEVISSKKRALIDIRAGNYPAGIANKEAENMVEAEKKLREAANLLGLDDDFYIRTRRIETPSLGFDTITIKTVAPNVEGESKSDREIRNRLAIHHLPSWEHQRNLAVAHAVDTLDSRRGGGASNTDTDQLVIRAIWGVWVEELKTTDVDSRWRPAKLASNILAYCGHEIESRKINTHAHNERTNRRERERLS